MATAVRPAAPDAGTRPVPDAVLRSVEHFLYREAHLLDAHRYEEWLELFTDDVHYWMPVRKGMPKPGASEFASEREMAFFDESKDSLRNRVAKFGTGLAWAEEPPSRTRHVITNIMVDQGDSESEVWAHSDFVFYRTRLESRQDILVGARQDLLRRSGDSWTIARRTILLDQTVLSADNLSMFL
ncbi:MAG TPA: 3-phenylpropionate/cinnamic acid dioxygenase subunit beta [Chloroflexota bacterium]|nr:3-phenylpropionate/cinnamic acid dioxygenase subunit beta [Chloroflexota bacterium]